MARAMVRGRWEPRTVRCRPSLEVFTRGRTAARAIRSSRRHGPGEGRAIVRRVMALWLPFWPAERRRAVVSDGKSQGAVDAPRLVIATDRGVRRIDATCPRAYACGVRPGMPLVEARARLAHGTVVEFERDAAGDRRTMRLLARWLLTFVPSVMVAEDRHEFPDREIPMADAAPEEHSLFADLTGCGRWLAWEASREGVRSPITGPALEAEASRLETIRRRLAMRGISARLAVAGTPGAAWAVARFGTGESPCRVLPPGHERAAIEPLPIECLRLAPTHAAILREVEVRTVADLLALDRDEVADRFRPGNAGSEKESRAGNEIPSAGRRRSSPRFCGGRTPARLVRALGAGEQSEGPRREAPTGPSPLDRLDQALGRVAEPLAPVSVARPSVVETVFAGPVTDAETIAIAFAGLVERLCRRLRRGDRAVRALRLRWVPVRGDPWVVPVELGHPTRRPGHLWTILRPIIESVPRLCSRRGRRGPARDPAEGFDAISIEAFRLVRTPGTGPDRDLEGMVSPSRPDCGVPRPARRSARDDPVGFLPAAECVDLFLARFGAARLEVATPDPGHRPEGECRFVPWRASRTGGRAGRRAMESLEDEDGRAEGPSGPRPTWRPPNPEPLVFVADDAVRWRGDEHPIRRVGPAEIFLERWWVATPAKGEGTRELLTRRLELRGGLGLWIVRERDSRERLCAVDVTVRDRLDAATSPACRSAAWRVIGIGA